MASVATSAGPLWLPDAVVSVLVATPSLPGHQAMKCPPPTVTFTCVPSSSVSAAPVTAEPTRPSTNVTAPLERWSITRPSAVGEGAVGAGVGSTRTNEPPLMHSVLPPSPSR